MDTEVAATLVNRILDFQYDMICRAEPWGMNHVEFLFVEASRLIETFGLRQWALDAIERSIERGYEANSYLLDSRPTDYLPHEFIFFFAHRTRWPEFAALAARLRGASVDLWRSDRLHTWSGQLEAALRDDWEDADFYQAFSRGTAL